MRSLRSTRPRAHIISVLVLILLVGLLAPAGALSAGEQVVTEVSAPVSHSWPPTDPLDPSFLGRLTGQGPPSGWIYHGALTLATCIDVSYNASYFWRGSTSLQPTSATSTMNLDANCLNTQFTAVRARATAKLVCLGGGTFNDVDTVTGAPAAYTFALAHVSTGDLLCQAGSTVHYSMEARGTRPNGTFVYYCNKANGVVGGMINELSANTSPC